MTHHTATRKSKEAKPVVAPAALAGLAWAVTLLVSSLPEALFDLFGSPPPTGTFMIKAGILLFLVGASRSWKRIQPLRPYLTILLVLLAGLNAIGWLRATPGYHAWELQAGWALGTAALQALKLGLVGFIVAALLRMGAHRQDIFLARGNLSDPVNSPPVDASATAKTGHASATPTAPRSTRSPTGAVRSSVKPTVLTRLNVPSTPGASAPLAWLTWGRLALLLGLAILPLTFLVFGAASLPSQAVLTRALPLLPVALLFAATNAFSEEVQFRASLLSTLRKAVVEDQALFLAAAFFGLAHYFGGSPSGWLGVVIASALGALFSKLMLGSKSLAAPWFVHFCQNAVIFAFQLLAVSG